MAAYATSTVLRSWAVAAIPARQAHKAGSWTEIIIISLKLSLWPYWHVALCVCTYFCKSAQPDGNIPLVGGHMLVKKNWEGAQTTSTRMTTRMKESNRHIINKQAVLVYLVDIRAPSLLLRVQWLPMNCSSWGLLENSLQSNNTHYGYSASPPSIRICQYFILNSEHKYWQNLEDLVHTLFCKIL